MRAFLLTLPALLLLLPGPTAAQIYKCVDQDGRVSYLQTKPAEGDCKGEAPAGSTGSRKMPIKAFESSGNYDTDRAKSMQMRRAEGLPVDRLTPEECARDKAMIARLKTVEYDTEKQGDEAEEYLRRSMNDLKRMAETCP